MNTPSLPENNLEEKIQYNDFSLKEFILKQFFRIINYWFVRYNPLYFFSAFCVLLGIFLISNNLVMEVEEKHWSFAHVLLVSVVQLYELLVVASIIFLVKWIKQYRPAVFLILLELFFLFDCTFRIETLSGLGTTGMIVVLCWVILAAFKLVAIAWALQLHKPTIPIVISMWSVIGIILSPYWFTLSYPDLITMYLLANWYGTLLIVFLFFFSPKIACGIQLDTWGETVLQRAIKASWSIIIGLYFYHLVNRLIWFEYFPQTSGLNLTLFITQLTPFITLIGVVKKQEKELWISGIVAIICVMLYPSAVPVNVVMVAIIWGMYGWKMDKPNLYLGVLLALYFDLWMKERAPHLSPLFSLENGILISGLVFLVLKWRLKAAIFLLSAITTAGVLFIGRSILLKILIIVKNIGDWLRHLFPQTAVGWGMFLLGSGFIILIVGVIVSWNQRQMNRDDMKSKNEVEHQV